MALLVRRKNRKHDQMGLAIQPLLFSTMVPTSLNIEFRETSDGLDRNSLIRPRSFFELEHCKTDVHILCAFVDNKRVASIVYDVVADTSRWLTILEAFTTEALREQGLFRALYQEMTRRHPDLSVDGQFINIELEAAVDRYQGRIPFAEKANPFYMSTTPIPLPPATQTKRPPSLLVNHHRTRLQETPTLALWRPRRLRPWNPQSGPGKTTSPCSATTKLSPRSPWISPAKSKSPRRSEDKTAATPPPHNFKNKQPHPI